MMDIDPAWAAAFSAAGGIALGGAAGWFGRYKVRARAARPVIALDGQDIIITNALDEGLLLVKIAANAQFALAFKGGKDDRREPEVEHWFRRSRVFRQDIGPRSQARLQMLLKSAGRPPVVYLTFDSSAGTLKRERVRVQMST